MVSKIKKQSKVRRWRWIINFQKRSLLLSVVAYHFLFTVSKKSNMRRWQQSINFRKRSSSLFVLLLPFHCFKFFKKIKCKEVAVKHRLPVLVSYCFFFIVSKIFKKSNVRWWWRSIIVVSGRGGCFVVIGSPKRKNKKQQITWKDAP